MRFQIRHRAIDARAFSQTLADPRCGALVQFEGWVRNHNEGRDVLRLEYEVYEPLAVREGERIIDEAIAKFGIRRAAAIHRAGLMELGDTAVIVGASAPHRDAAFDACRYIIDQAKIRLPIWKKEYYADGAAEWVNCQRCAAHAHGS
ncbi:MAG: molybdenum cofactor biosynthesis protein MoaE [Xanthomonadales bacterium]